MRTLFLSSLRPWYIAIASAILLAFVLQHAEAAVFGGGGIIQGINAASGLGGIVSATSITDLIFKIITFILNLALLLAMLAIIVAGIYLIVSNGDEGQKDKAKKIVIYAVVGLLLILFARVIVVFVNNIFG